MNARLSIVLDRLERIPWFSTVGSGALLPGTLAADGLSQALKCSRSRAWFNFRLMLRNRNFADLSRLNYAAFVRWDEVVADAAPRVDALLSHAGGRLLALRGTKPADLASLAPVVWGLLFEEFHEEHCPTRGLGRTILPALESGRLPCGWVGPGIDEVWAGASHEPLPAGQIRVF